MPSEDEPQLCSVVEIALESLPLLVADPEDPLAARLDVVQRLSQPEPKPDHLHQRRRGGSDVPQELAGRARRTDEPDRVSTEEDRHLDRSVEERFAGEIDSCGAVSREEADAKRRIAE